MKRFQFESLSLRQNSATFRLRSFLFNMNQAPYQLSWQGACPGAVLPAPTHSQALRAPSGVCGPVPFSPMSGRPPGRSWNSPVKRNRRSRNEKADTSVSRLPLLYAPCLSPPLGEKLFLVGLLTHTSRRLCRQRISPAFPAQASDPLSRKEDTLRAYSYVPIRTERSWAVFRNFT